MKYLAFLYLTLASSISVTAIPLFQDFFWEKLELPREFEGKKLLSDQNGFLWIGGKGEMIRHDGQNWEYFRLPTRASVSSLAQAPEGKIWVGTESGDIFIWENGYFKKINFSEPNPTSAIRKIIFDKSGKAWIATYGEGIFIFEKENSQKINSKDHLPSDFVYDLSQGPKGQIWAATDQGLGLCQWEDKRVTIKPVRKKDGLPDELVTTVLHDFEGTAWIGTYDKGSFFKKKEDTGWTALPAQRFDGVKSMQLLGQGVLIQDEAGRLIHPGWHHSKILKGKKTKAFYISQEGHIWVLGIDNELFHAGANTSILLLPILGLQAMESDSTGNLWLGTDKGLFLFSPENGLLEEIHNSTNLNITSLCVDRWGKIWIGTLEQGIWTFDPAIRKFTRQNVRGFKNNIPILSLLPTNRQIWVGSFAGGYIIELDREGNLLSERNIAKPQGLGINYIYQLSKGTQNRVYISADGEGISVAEGNVIHSIEELAGTTIFSHTSFREEKLLCLTDLGELLFFENSKLDTLLRYENTPPLALTALDSTRALVVYEDALFVVDLLSREVYPFFGGLQSMDMGKSLNVFSHSSSQSLWLGTSKSLIHIVKNGLSKFNCREVLLKKLLVNLEETSVKRKSFNSNENHLTLEYASPWWKGVNVTSFQHRLKGYDLDWVSSKDMRAIYPKLQAGKYTFEARIVGPNQKCAGSSLSYSFEIQKPFWQKTWFVILGIFLLVFTFMASMRWQENRINLRKERENILVKNQLDTLTSQINPHFLFNAFSTLTDIVDESKPKAIAYINRLSDLFRNMLAYRNQALIKLKEELELLDNYYQLQKERYGENFSLVINLNDDLRETKIPPMILQILTENALKHNKLSKETPLEVLVYAENEFLVVKNKIQPKLQAVSSTKIGLNNIRERYRLLTGREVEIHTQEGHFMVMLPIFK